MPAVSGQPSRTRWHEARIVAVRQETSRVKAFRLATGWTRPHRAGQHLDVRLTAPDGYQAQRSYSISSAPFSPPADAALGGDAGEVEILVEALEGGEVSGYFHGVAAPGDLVEVRGPIGRPFTWDRDDGGPLLLAGGGSGVAPLLSILRHRGRVAPGLRCALLLSARTEAEAVALAELRARSREEPGFKLFLALTRDPAPPPDAWRRLDKAAIREALAWLRDQPRHAYVCGSNRFAGPVAGLIVDEGVASEAVHVERFGG